MTRVLSVLNQFFGAAPGEHSSSLVLPLVHLNLVLYSCAFWMQQPVMPEKIKSLNASEMEYGSLQSFSAVLALLGSTYMGRIVDVHGAKTGLMLAQAASGLLYLTAAFSTTVNQMYFTAFPAFFQHAMLCCSAAVASLSSNDLRAVALGRLGLSYGVGMSVGSPIGGWIAKELGVQAAFLSAATVSLMISVFNLFVLPSLKPKSDGVSEPKQGLDMKAVWRVATSSGVVRNLMSLSFASGLATSAFRAMFALAAIEEFGLNSQDLGFLMSFTAFVSLITNVFLIGWTVTLLGERATLILSLVVQSVAFVAMFVASHLPKTLVLISIPQSVSSTVFYTLCSSMFTKSVVAKDQGTAVSLSHAMRSLTQVIAPILGGFIMKRYHFAGVGLFAASLTFVAALQAAWGLRDVSVDSAYKVSAPATVVENDGGPQMKEEKSRVD